MRVDKQNLPSGSGGLLQTTKDSLLPIPSFDDYALCVPGEHLSTHYNCVILIPQCYFNTAKLDFPNFVGDNACRWIQKANRYFAFNLIEESHKVLFACLQLQGREDSWYQTHSKPFNSISWEAFMEALQEIFYKNIVGKFNKLVQLISIYGYQEKLEEPNL